MSKKAKIEELKKTMAKLNKTYGDGTISTFAKGTNTEVESIPTGSLLLDNIIGCGGYPKGRFVEIFGENSVGKTLSAMECIAACQKQGIVCCFIDIEQSFPAVYAKQVGVNLEELIFVQPDGAEQAIDICRDLVETGEVGVIVMDSIAALVPHKETEGEIGDANIALRARLMSKACRVLPPLFRKTGCVGIWINQTRQNINPYGSPIVTPGGQAMKFTASLRLHLKRGENINLGGKTIGHILKITVKKNKVGSSVTQTIETELLYGEGINRQAELLTLAIEKDIINKAGSWYSYGETKIGQGRDAVKQFLEDNPELMEEIEKQIAS